MKKTTQSAFLICLMTGFASVSVQAQEVGRVISSTPIIQQVAVPRQVCSNDQVVTEGKKSGAGAVIGAIAGGAVGHQVGGGTGRSLATVAGAVSGAVLGDKIEGRSNPEVRNVQSCSTQMSYENRITAYNVVYEFAGQRYTVQMPQDPGPTVRIQITPVAYPPANPNYTFPSEDSAPRY
jgi:uncharacterized protein YcfJ